MHRQFNKHMEIEKKCSDLLKQNLPPESLACGVCFFEIDEDSASAFDNEQEKWAMQQFKRATSNFTCVKCQRKFHKHCIQKSKIPAEDLTSQVVPDKNAPTLSQSIPKKAQKSGVENSPVQKSSNEKRFENFTCETCQKQAGMACVVCLQTTGTHIKVLTEKTQNVFGHFVCLYFSANFALVDPAEQQFAFTASATSEPTQNPSQKYCAACNNPISDSDSRFTCKCGLSCHIYCALHCQSMCPPEANSEHDASGKLGVMKVDVYKKTYATKKIGNEILSHILKKITKSGESLKSNDKPKSGGQIVSKNRDSFRSHTPEPFMGSMHSHTSQKMPEVPKSEPTLNRLVATLLKSKTLELPIWEFEMECAQCFPDSSPICCYKNYQDTKITVCSICSNWIHATIPECSQKREQDTESIAKYLSEKLGIKKIPKKRTFSQKKPRAKDVELDDSVFLCKSCVHFSTLLLPPPYTTEITCRPKNVVVSLFVLAHLTEKPEEDQALLVGRLASHFLLRTESLELAKEIKTAVNKSGEKMSCEGVKDGILEYIRNDSRVPGDIEETKCELDAIFENSIEATEEMAYLKCVLELLINLTKYDLVTFPVIQESFRAFTRAHAKIPRDATSATIYMFAKSFCYDQFQAAFSFIESLIEKFDRTSPNLADTIGGKENLCSADLMCYLQSKVNHDEVMAEVTRTSNNMLLCYLKYMSLEPEVENFLHTFESTPNVSFETVRTYFTQIMQAKIWVESLRNQVNRFLNMYIEAIHFEKQVAKLSQKIQSVEAKSISPEGLIDYVKWRAVAVPTEDVQALLGRKSCPWTFKIDLAAIVEESNRKCAVLVEFFETNQANDAAKTLKYIFAETNSSQIGLTPQLLSVIDKLLMAYKFEAFSSPLFLQEYMSLQQQAQLALGDGDAVNKICLKNMDREKLEADISTFENDPNFDFFSECTFQKFDQMQSRCISLNLKNQFLDALRTNYDYYNSFIVSVIENFTIENDIPSREQLAANKNKIGLIVFPRLLELSEMVVTRWVAAELAEVERLIKIQFVESYLDGIRRRRFRPGVTFLKKYCAETRTVCYVDLLDDSEKIIKTRNIDFIEQLGRAYDDFVKEFAEIKRLFSDPYFYKTIEIQRLSEFLGNANIFDFEDPIIFLEIKFIFLQRVLLEILQVAARQKQVMAQNEESQEEKRRMEELKGGAIGSEGLGIQKGENNGGPNGRNGFDGTSPGRNLEDTPRMDLEMDEMNAREVSQHETPLSTPESAAGQDADDLEYQVQKCEFVFSTLTLLKIPTNFANPEIALIFEKFCKRMKKFSYLKNSEKNISELLTRNNFGNRFHKIDTSTIAELIIQMKKHVKLYAPKISFYQKLLENFATLEKKAEIMFQNTVCKPIDQLLCENELNPLLVFEDEYQKQQVKSKRVSELVEAIGIAKSLMVREKLEDSAVLYTLLSNLEKLLAEHPDSVLLQSVFGKKQEFERVWGLLRQLRTESITKKAFLSRLLKLRTYLDQPGLKTCFDYASFDHMRTEIDFFTEGGEKKTFAEYSDFVEATKCKIVFYQSKNIEIEDTKCRIQFLNQFVDKTSKAFDMAFKMGLYWSVTRLSGRICLAFSFNVKLHYDEIDHKRVTFIMQQREMASKLERLMGGVREDFTRVDLDLREPSYVSDVFRQEKCAEGIDPIEHVVFQIRKFVLETLFCVTGVSKSNHLACLKKIMTETNILQVLNQLETNFTKSESFEASYIESLKSEGTRYLALLSCVSCDFFDDSVKRKAGQAVQKAFLDFKDAFRRDPKALAMQILQEYGFTTMKALKTVLFDAYQTVRRRKINEICESFYTSIGYFDKFLPVSKSKKLSEPFSGTRFYERHKQPLEQMLADAILILNSQYKNSPNGEAPYKPKFKIQMTKTPNLSKSNSVSQNAMEFEEESVNFKLVSLGISAKQDIHLNFRKLVKFAKMVASDETELEKMIDSEFDARKFMEWFEVRMISGFSKEKAPKTTKKDIPIQTASDVAPKRLQKKAAKNINLAELENQHSQDDESLEGELRKRGTLEDKTAVVSGAKKDSGNKKQLKCKKIKESIEANDFLLQFQILDRVYDFTGFEISFEGTPLELKLYTVAPTSVWDSKALFKFKFSKILMKHSEPNVYHQKMLDSIKMDDPKNDKRFRIFLGWFFVRESQQDFNRTILADIRKITYQFFTNEFCELEVAMGNLSLLPDFCLPFIRPRVQATDLAKIPLVQFFAVTIVNKKKSFPRKETSSYYRPVEKHVVPADTEKSSFASPNFDGYRDKCMDVLRLNNF